MATQTPAQPRLTGKQIRSYLMRTTGPQQYYVQPWSDLTQFNIAKNIPLNQPLAFLHITLEGRLTLDASGGYTPLPEAPQNLLQLVRLQGSHAKLGSLALINMSGATLFALNKILSQRGNSICISDNGGSLNRIDPLDQFPTGLTAAQFGTASHAYDFQVFWTVPVFPYGVSDDQAVQYLLNAAAWGQTLQLQLTTGDVTSLGAAKAHATLSAFGSASGSPSININLTYVSLGPLAASINQAVSVKNSYSIAGQLSSVQNQVRLQLLQNQRTLNVLTKTGTQQTGTSAGVVVYATLSDAILQQNQVRVNNNPVRNLQFNEVTKEFYGLRGNTVMPQGYLNISFSDGEPTPNSFAGFKGEQLPGSAQFDIAANVISSPANVTGEVVQDMIYGEPVVAGQ